MYQKNILCIPLIVGIVAALPWKLDAYKAVVIVPVADLVGSPIKNLVQATTTLQGYQTLPHASAGAHRAACPRMHQVLFNEIVEVIEECNDEVKVSISSAFYTISEATSPQKTYWMLKKNLIPLTSIAHADTVIPPTPDFSAPDTIRNAHVVSLLQPLYDPVSAMTFSAGTRFFTSKNQPPHALHTIAIVRYNPHTKKAGIITLDRSACSTNLITLSHKERIDLFVRIMKEWAQPRHGIIPYVLGGTSFCTRLADTICSPQPLANNAALPCYLRNDDDTLMPKVGMDCSGLILRAAHIAGIPYFAKNTKTIASQLKPLGREHSLQEGDLIVMHGHVIIISDIPNNMVIEARSYDHGYGKIHELPIGKIFKDIPTLDALVHAHHARTAVERIDKHGVVRDHFPCITIMRMESAWNITQ